MNKQAIEYMIMFLNRTELKGSEVPLFNTVMVELEREYNNKEVKPTEVIEQQSEDTEDYPEDEDEQPEEEKEITEKDIKKEKKKVEDLMKEIDEL